VKHLHVVTSCTDRKLAPVHASVRLRELREQGLKNRVRYWTGRLEGAPAPRVTVRSLYGGEHWTEFLKLVDSPPSGYSITAWVISAGLGLVPIDASVPAYDATFSRQSPDAVRPTGVTWSESDWWSALSDWTGLSDGPRRLSDLAGAPVLLAASDNYLRAVQDDLEGLIDAPSPSPVTVFSSRAPAYLAHRPEFVTYDSRLQELFGGSKVALNVRTMSFALAQAQGCSTLDLRAVVEQAMSNLGEPAYPLREAAQDDELRVFIRSAIAASPKVRPTPLLRRWREQNRACEQGRFRELFWDEYKTVLSNAGQQMGMELA
jgi:hypothetical protein